MAQPNFRISDVMREYIDCDLRESKSIRYNLLHALIDYRKQHPYKFAETLRYAFGQSVDGKLIARVSKLTDNQLKVLGILYSDHPKWVPPGRYPKLKNVFHSLHAIGLAIRRTSNYDNSYVYRFK